MKKLFTTLSLACMFLGATSANAQSFESESGDTVSTYSGTTYTLHNNIKNTHTSAITLQWRAIATTFPGDWLATIGVCDNKLCYSEADVWPSVTQESLPYAVGLGDFHILGDLTGTATPGPYFIRIRMNNKDIPADTAIQTYIVSKNPTGVSVVKTSADVVLYPNPATSSLNVLFNPASDIKNIAVYNIIGKQMNMYRVTDKNSANLNVENIPSGIYFVRLLNSRGDVVVTRKFTKQ